MKLRIAIVSVLLAAVVTSLYCLIAIYLTFTRFGERSSSDAVLRFAMPARGEQEGLLRQILQHYCRGFALVHLRESGPESEMEFAYQVKMFDMQQTTGLVTDMGTIPGVSGIDLLVQNEDEEV